MNNAILIRRMADAFNRQDVDALTDLYHDDAEIFPTPAFALPGTTYHGSDGIRTLLAGTFARFASIRIELSDISHLGAWMLVHQVVSFIKPDGGAEARETAWLYAIDGGRVRVARAVAHGFPAPDAALEAAPTAVTTPRLTRREREVFRLLALGFNGPEIAQRLVLSPDTVRTHVHNGIVRLGARTRAQAVALALTTHDITL
jgi:DNA-binding CsgD family transcriptional regulator